LRHYCPFQEDRAFFKEERAFESEMVATATSPTTKKIVDLLYSYTNPPPRLLHIASRNIFNNHVSTSVKWSRKKLNVLYFSLYLSNNYG
jgi:hypothetical protein